MIPKPTIRDYITATLQFPATRKLQAMALLTSAGHTENEARIIHEAADEATRAAAFAVADILDGITTDKAIQATAIPHVMFMLAADLTRLRDQLSDVITVVAMGGDSQDITKGNPVCACDVCTATRALTDQLIMQMELK